MAITYNKENVIQYEVELFKTTPTPINSIMWEVLANWTETNTDYTEAPESEIVMASYQAFLNCLESKGKILSATSIGAISVAYAGNTGNTYVACVDNIYTILNSLNLDVDFKQNIATFFTIDTDNCNGCG